MIEMPDGLRLHVRQWRSDGAGLPIVCLPGLSRPLEDFGALADFLSAEPGGRRRVVAISARGRGRSDRDADPKRYDVRVESSDAIAVLDALSIPRAVLVGTSRGGLQAMTIAALRPQALAGVVLNDVGPVIETVGLARIRGYLAEPGAPSDWADATERLKLRYAETFPALARDDFAAMARRTWREGPEGLEPTYDPALLRAFDGLDLTQPPPTLWPLFDALARVPLMVVRGERSDVLSAATVAEMARRRPDISVAEVPGQGHAPLLADRPTQKAIAAFVASVDA